MNEQAKYTPGPWRADRRCIEAPTPPGSDCTLPTITLAEVRSGGCGSQQADANGLLMAAAPDLLEAAAAVVARWDTPNWKDAAPTGEVIARLRAAIAKARGEQQ